MKQKCHLRLKAGKNKNVKKWKKSIAKYFEFDDIKQSIKESMGDLDKALLKLYQ